MSEKTTPQTGSAEKEPLLNNETADHTSAEELPDQKVYFLQYIFRP